MNRILLFFMVATSFLANAQNAQIKIDELKKELSTNPDDKKRATIYSDLTWYYSNVSLDSAMVFGKKAITESVKLGDSALIAQVYSDVGAVYFRKGDYDNSQKNYLKAYQIRKNRKDYMGMSKVNNNLGNIYLNRQNYKLAMKCFLDVAQYCELNKDYKTLNVVNRNIGLLFLRLKNYKKAEAYLKVCIAVDEKDSFKDGLCNTYLNMGNVYLGLKDSIKANFFYDKSLSICKEIGNKTGIAAAFSNLATMKTSQKSPDQAMQLYAKSKEQRNSLNSGIEKSLLNLKLAKVYIEQKQYDKSYPILISAKKIFEKNKFKDNLLLTYQFLVPVYIYRQQPDSAYYCSEESHKLSAFLVQNQISKQTAELETRYQTAKKEKQIIQQQAEAKQKNFYLLGLGVLSLLIGLIGFLIYKQQRQKNQQQAQENQLKLAIEKIENQNKLQEQRLSISRDLHDNIGSQLTFIISSVDNVKYGFDITNKKLDDKLTNISSFAKDTILELRDTIWAMNNNEIRFEDLEIRITNFIEKAKLSRENISFSFAIDPDLKNQKLSSIEGMNVYRTIQEAINNSLKYAKAEIVSVNIKKQSYQTKITISDNGVGFDLETIEKGNGLNNMKKRIEEIGGKFALNSNNDGTKIEILLNS